MDPQLRASLTGLIEAWQSDSSSEVRSAMAICRKGLPTEVRQRLEAALGNYDFKEGLAITHALIASYPKQEWET
jgi:hypothetical protein